MVVRVAESGAMRLADRLARRRVLYPRPLPTLPDLCVIDIAKPFAAPRLPLGRFYPVIIETAVEWIEWEAFLTADREKLSAPDLLDRRPSRLLTAAITFAHYDPPEAGWPWILLCHWPRRDSEIACDRGDHFARSAYTIELLPDEIARRTMECRLLEALGQSAPLKIVNVPPSAVAIPA